MADRLTVKKIEALNDAGLHADGQVTGLYLSIAKTGSKSFIQRIMVGGKRKDIGFRRILVHQSRNGERVGY